MRLIKQSFLYFKEGNSDKVYEIDLCDVGNDKYVVNFRYGRRGAQLKEGSKTPVPVTLAEAEKIYDALETEKLNKGYTTSESGEPTIPAKTAFSLDSGTIVLNTNWTILPASRNKAILQRLHNAVNGTTTDAKFQWKLSRVIWKAGTYKIKEAAPYIIKLFSNGNQLHQYCCTWALVRCFDGNALTITALKAIHVTHPVAAISKLAGAGLVKHSEGIEKETQLTQYTNRLPEDLKKAIAAENETALNQLLQVRIVQQQPNYNWLEDLYIIATEKRWVRTGLKKILNEIPFRPNYFKHTRAIFKLAELLDDFEITGLLACRFEREQEMFRHNISFANAADEEIYIPEIEEWVKLQKEFKKNSSRLAYSQKTRWYFHNRVFRQLLLTGKNDDTDYVKLATALLIGYKFTKDFKAHYSTYNYVWNRGTYDRIETRFLQNAQAVFLHQVLSGNNPEIVLQSNHLWRIRTGNEKPAAGSNQQKPKSTEGEGLGGLIKKITGLFSKKKEPLLPAPEAASTNPVENTVDKNGTPFLHLWNKVPQAYLQLMMDGELEEVHQFAADNLTIHPEYNTIKQRLDKQAYKQLLLSAFEIPANFGFTLAAEKYSNSIPDDDLVLAMLNSINTEAQNKGRQWGEDYKATYFQQSNFITALIFAKHAAIRSWGKELIKNNTLTADIKNAVVGKAVAELMSYGEQTTENERIIKDAGDTLFELFGDALQQVNIGVTADMLQHENAAVLLFGLRLLKIQKQQLDLDNLSGAFLSGLLQHQQALVREEGIEFLSSMSDAALLRHQEDIIGYCLSPYENLRKGLPPVIQRMAQKENAFGVKAAENLMPFLLRKETTEGLHADVSKLLCNQLSNYLQNANKETALNLLYSNYSAAQNVGVIILEKYTDPSQLTIPQVIALGGHENLNVREWCWKFYSTQSPRIKYEKETSIRITESKWQDTRQFAMQYFRENFTEADWNAETLITLADSIKPDVEAFGRELITKFFTAENGVQYLLQLSQHPSEKMQLFATNYLERFAAGDAHKIQSLDFYFRSVLTRVNKSRIAKNRIYLFLLEEGRKSEAVAKVVCTILSDVSAIAAIGDKAKCIDILLQLKALYDVITPVKIKETEIRMASNAS
ncbi:WGR domain-containing protein [Ferruginibacter profundus]